MQKTIAILTIGLATALITGCTKNKNIENPNTKADAPITPIMIAAPVNKSISGFSFNFFRELLKENKPGDNIFVSPLSLHMAMGMVANGATGETRAEILKTLDAGNLSMDDLNKSYLTLLEELPKVDPKVKLALANSIWYKNDFSVEADFLKQMKDYFKAQVTGLPFQPSDLAIINKWASDNTNGKIPKVLDEFESDLVMLLMNALYFKGDWRAQFKKADTKTENFTKVNGSTMQVKMMHMEDTVRYTSTSKFQAIQKPYGNGQFTMTIILPGKEYNGNWAELLSESDWNSLQNSSYTSTVKIGLPKFKLEQDFELKNTLNAMGIKKAFTNLAEFDALSKRPTKISFVKQNTFAAVDEEGTEAAAVTVVGMKTFSSGPYVPPQFICDRPFGIIISETTSNTILFMGRIAEPISP